MNCLRAHQARSRIGGLAFALALFGCTVGDGSAQQSVDAQRIKSLASQFRIGSKDRSAMAAATALRQAGDQKYLRSDFRGAQRQYREAYPNVPAPYSFVMAADSQLRALAEWNSPRERDMTQCLKSKVLGGDLRSELSQVYSVGLGVATAVDDSAFLASALFRRAKLAEACLWGLVKSSEAAAEDACADLGKLKACLGPPLIP
jgi:hypothetical protein